MPLKKLMFKPGINKEVSRYTAEGGWYECDKVRFRKGLPEKIGGWRRTSSNFFKGICRSLFVWTSNGSSIFSGIGTHLKYYVDFGGLFFDITPIRLTTSPGVITFSAQEGSVTLTVFHTDHGARQHDFVTFSGAVSLGGNVAASVLNKEHQITRVVNADSYEITLTIPAINTDTGNGGAAVVGAYQVNTGPEITVAVEGWGSGAWGDGSWGQSVTSTEALRVWNHSNFGQALVYGPAGGGLYYWDPENGVLTRGIAVSDMPGASDVPIVQNYLLVSDVFRFVFVFGTNDYGTTTKDNMLIRWSDQEDITQWTPAATNQAGSLRLSRGSTIVTAIQARQEVLVFTDSSLYSLQYLGAPAVWGAQLVGSNTTIVSNRAVAYANGIAYWMGKDSFYQYDGRIQPLPSDLLSYVFDDINRNQYEQVFAGSVEAFNEIWWFYCSANSEVIDRYVIFDYVEGDWAYGTMNRTAWLDSSLLDYPIAATYNNNIVRHEDGVDDNETDEPKPIYAYVQSGDFDLEDGDRVMFVWRCLPDVQFNGSTNGNPSVDMTFIPKYSPGAAPLNPESVGGQGTGVVTRTSTVPISEHTNQINTRVRGRQLAIKIESKDLGVHWKLGSPLIDMRPDGRR